MSVGFNSDVTIGENVCHVQTENHGHPQCRIETLVYHRGRILHRRNSSYLDLAAVPDFAETAVSRLVEDQHRSVIEELRRGEISVPVCSATENSPSSQGIKLRLRNASSWLADGFVTLDIEVIQRSDGRPVRSANIETYLSGAKETSRFAATTGEDGRAQLRFAAPAVGADGTELVIRARVRNSSVGVDEIRYVLRARPKSPAPKAKS